MKKINERMEDAKQAHLQSMHELKSSIRRGDWVKVKEKTGISSLSLVMHSFNRVNSKRHLSVYNALYEVVTERMKELEQHTI